MRLVLPAIAGLAVALGVYSWVGGGSGSGSCGTAVALSAAGRQALAAYAGRIQLDVDRTPDGHRNETWYDAVTGRTRQLALDPRGRVTGQFTTVRQGGFEISTFVDYEGRNWTVERTPIAGGDKAPVNSAAMVSAHYRAEAGLPATKLLDTESIGGHPTLHLRELQHLTAPQLPKGMPKGMAAKLTPTDVQIDTWLDPLTYLPVRTRTDIDGQRSRTDETWLPRTPNSVSATRLVLPAGFKQLHPAQSNGTVYTDLTARDSCGHS